MRKITSIISMIGLLFINNISIAQDFKFGKISEEKGQRLKGVVGQIGNSVYTTSFKGDNLFINKCSAETMVIESSEMISTDNMDLKKYSWDVLKVDNKIVFIIAVWDRDAPNKIYGKILVDGDGKIKTGGNLKLITEWKSPDYKGKKLTMGRDIKIISSEEVDGLSSANNKILVYYVHFAMISATNGNKDLLMSCVIIDKDLNKTDEQYSEFDEIEEYHLSEPKMDVEGNFYSVMRGFNHTTRDTHFYSLIYDAKSKKLNQKIISLNKFKSGEAPTGMGNYTINAKNNFLFTGLYGDYGKYGVLTAKGFCGFELNVKGECIYDYMLFSEDMFNKPNPGSEKNTVSYYSRVAVGLTKNYIIICNPIVGLNKKGASKGKKVTDYAVVKWENTKFKIVKTYSTEFITSGDLSETIKPTFIESKDKLFMITAPYKDNCEALNLQKPSEEVCLLTSFDLTGGAKTTFLYNIDKPNPIPRYNYKLKDGSLVMWGNEDQAPVKISFK